VVRKWFFFGGNDADKNRICFSLLALLESFNQRSGQFALYPLEVLVQACPDVILTADRLLSHRRCFSNARHSLADAQLFE